MSSVFTGSVFDREVCAHCGFHLEVHTPAPAGTSLTPMCPFQGSFRRLFWPSRYYGIPIRIEQPTNTPHSP